MIDRITIADASKVSAADGRGAKARHLYLAAENFADDAVWPVQFEPRRYIRPQDIAAVNGGYAIDEDAELAKAGTDLAGEILFVIGALAAVPLICLAIVVLA